MIYALFSASAQASKSPSVAALKKHYYAELVACRPDVRAACQLGVHDGWSGPRNSEERRGRLGPDRIPCPPIGTLADTADPTTSDDSEPRGRASKRLPYIGGDLRSAECSPVSSLMRLERARGLDSADADGDRPAPVGEAS